MIHLKITESQKLSPAEKETVIHFHKDKMVSISTDFRSGIKYLLELEDAEIERTETEIIDGEECIVSVKARIPKNYLKLKSKPRANHYVSNIF